MTIKGTCFCGTINYEINGKLPDAAPCHCSMCRKMFNSQPSPYALLKPADFKWAA